MKRFSFIIFLWVTFLSLASAQHLSRHYHDRSMSDVLIDLDKASARYKVSFIYNELEDFTVTQNVEAPNIPDAIRRVIGFYPMKMVVSDSLITVECIRKSERKLIGRLIDNHNLPVEFANVQLLNPHDSTFLCGGVSNANGDFVIPCEQNQAIMKVSYVGYKTLTVKAANGMKITLQEDGKVLNDVVVTALGIKRDRKALGYGLSEVKGEELTKAKETNVINSLSGKVAGLVVQNTAGGASGSTRVLLRGNTEMAGNNQPLYVVDGVPLDNTNFASAGEAGGYDLGDGISAINPDDIETMTVLKGPAASAL